MAETDKPEAGNSVKNQAGETRGPMACMRQAWISRLALPFLAVALCAFAVLAADPPPTSERRVVSQSGTTVADPKGSCLSFNGLTDAIIENVVIGPCGEHGIELIDSKRVLIRNVTIKGTVGSGVFVMGSQDIDVVDSQISDTITGVYAERSSAIRVSCNTIVNPRGPIPRGQFVQFNRVEGANSNVRCNIGRNEPAEGRVPEDGINLYKSTGTPQSPIIVEYNLLTGGGPSESGGGIMLGDSGGEFQIARNNTLVDPGQYGIAISSGNDIEVLNNKVFGRKQAFTNVGIYVWNQYPPACHSHTVSGNQVKWISKVGRANGWWNGRNCGAIEGVAGNNFAAPVDAGIANEKAPECGCTGAGRK